MTGGTNQIPPPVVTKAEALEKLRGEFNLWALRFLTADTIKELYLARSMLGMLNAEISIVAAARSDLIAAPGRVLEINQRGEA